MTRLDAPLVGTAERRTLRRRTRRSAASVVGNTLLNIAAAGGLLCIVLVILAFCFDITLIMFKTGSMSPGIPAGSLAVVREIPAADVAADDVVTVDRPGKLPVTHRVTRVADGTTADTRLLTLKGDANRSEDPAPYEVSTVRIVIASAPGLAYGVVWFSSPWVLGGLTLGCSVLVTWAFWPRSGRARKFGAGQAVLIAVVVGTGLAVGAAPAPASAAPETDVVTGQALVLTTIGDTTAMRSMSPGNSVPWEVGIATRPGVDPGRIDVSMTWTGSSALDLVVTADSCSQQWTAGGCRGASSRLVTATSAPVDAVPRALLSMLSDQSRWVRFSVLMPEDASGVGSAALTVTATGIGDDLAVSPGMIGTLPQTGARVDFALWAGAIAVAMGLSVAGLAAARQRMIDARNRW